MSRRLLFLIVGLFAFTSAAFGQGVRRDGEVTVDIFGTSRPVANATVRVCSAGSTGNPCTPLANIYSDAGLTMPLANPTSTDRSGNYHFYALAGPYDIQVSGNQVTTYTQANVPIPCIPGATGCSGGGGGGTPCTVNALSIQFNNAGAFGCVDISSYSASNHTITLTASAVTTTPLALAAFSTSATAPVLDINNGASSTRAGLFSLRGTGVTGFNSLGSSVLESSVVANQSTANAEFCNNSISNFYCVIAQENNNGSFFFGQPYGALSFGSTGTLLNSGSSPNQTTVIQNKFSVNSGATTGNTATLSTVGWSGLGLGGGFFINGTTGQAGIGVAVAAGNPCVILLPTSSPSSGQVLSVAAPVNNACQTSWINGGGGGGGGSVFPVTVSGAVNSGGIPCFNSTTNEQTSAVLGSGQFVLGGGVGACPSTSYSVIPVTAGGTGAITAPNALINLFPTASEVGDIIYCATFSGGACAAWSIFPGNVSGTKYLQENASGVPLWASSSTTVALSSITAATTTNTVASGNNRQTWNWALTSASGIGLLFGETSAATGGSLGSQEIVAISGASGSTATPLLVQDSLSGSQILPALYDNCIWNTTGVVDACLLVNATNTASGTGSKLLDLQFNASSVFAVDKLGNLTMSGYLPIGNVGTSGLSGTSPITISAGGAIGCSTCVTSASSALSSLTAATTTNTIANGNNRQTWNWHLTSASGIGLLFGESSASTGGSLGSQELVAIVTAGGSTATPLLVENSLTGSQTLPGIYDNCLTNTTGVVDACLLVNMTDTSSGAGSLLLDLQENSTSQFSVTKAGNVAALGSISLGSSPSGACGSATNCFAFNEASTAGTPTSTSDYMRADSTKHGFVCSVNNSTESQASCIGPQYSKWLDCDGKGLGDGLNAIPAGTYLQSSCKNITGVTVTITGVQCFTDNNGSSTLNAAGNTLGALLTGAITCTTSYAAGTQSANVALTANDYIKFTFVADGTSKQSDWVVTGTY